ncbi:MAG: 2-amino-4-hydroxy-6-hydroxymethyldihydropteridine diphosphokinase [Betaproteobacteria bacterium]|nr:2-amino-4-hydroxy-6-hydroxymethyldihydropteridine diphosphokinase [Betaproteobacteria bacterium]
MGTKPTEPARGARPWVQAFIGLGANLGQAPIQLAWAADRIGEIPQLQVLARSSLYRSQPLECAPGDAEFFNAVLSVQTGLSAPDLLKALLDLEERAGRQRPYRNAPRLLDIDLLIYGEGRIDSPLLIVPHPRIWGRAFVLQPLAEVAPDRVSPQALSVVSGQRLERCATWP